MFENRRQAGEALAAALDKFKDDAPVVYALPRGGLPVAAAVAESLRAPLDLILVRKLGAPMQPELAIGAIADGATHATVLNDELVASLGVGKAFIECAERDALAEIDRRRGAFFKDHKAVPAKGRNVIIVDDGLATGATMEAAIGAMRKSGAARVIVAVPVAPLDVAEKFRRLVDEFVCLDTPDPFWAVGSQYRAFPQLTDADVIRILSDYETSGSGEAERRGAAGAQQEIGREI